MTRKFVLLAGVSLVFAPTSAFAQDQNSALEAATGLEEIIVTAQKREENMQDVPVSVTALSAAAIENQRIVQFSDLTRAAPSLTISEGTSANNSSIFLRGIGTTAFSTSVEPSVSVVIDDIAVVQQAQAFANLSDIERVEVLRGPQGTLFGKNASAGVVNVVTKGPSDNFTGGFQISATDDTEIRAEAMVSGPLGDTAGFRLNGYYTYREGFFRNLTTGNRTNGEDGFGFRGKFNFDASDKLTVKLAADYSERNSTTGVRSLRFVGAGARSFGVPTLVLAPSLVGITPGSDNFKVRLNDEFDSHTKQFSGSAKFILDLGGASLTSISSYQDWKYSYSGEDVDGTDLNVLGALTGGLASGGLAQGGPFHATSFTQELRVASDGAGPFKYLAGLYYSDANTDRAFARGPVTLLAGWDSTASTRSLAAFAQLDYDISDRTRIGGGIRVNNEKIGVDFTNLIIPAVPPANNATCLVTCTGSDKETAVTYKISLQHDLADRVMAFATFATGYKGQGFDISTGFTPARAARPVSAEHSKAYEIGIKSRLFDNRLQLNLTGFWTDYDDFQAQAGVIDAVTGLVQLGLNNVGKLRTKGIELEMSAEPVSGLRIDGSAAYVDAKIRAFPAANCYVGQAVTPQVGSAPMGVGCFDADGTGPGTTRIQNLAGANLANSPKFKFNLGGVYTFALGGSGMKGSFGLNYQYQTKVNFDLFQNPLTVQPAYGVLNGNIGLDSGEDSTLKVTLFVNNIFDKHYVANIADGYSTFGNVHVLTQSFTRNSQRHFGVKLKYEY
jgi:iron complex outermembrane receptor protein